MQQHRCNQAQPHCKQFRGFQASLNAMSGPIIYHWMPGVHTHSPNTGSLCYMGLDWNVWPLCLEVTKRAMNISFGSRHSLSQSWEEKQPTVHTRSPCTTCTTGSRWNMGLECLHVSCSEHFSKKISREDFIRRKTPDGPMTPSWQIDFDQISVSTPDIGEDFNWFWPDIGFNSWYRWRLQLLMTGFQIPAAFSLNECFSILQVVLYIWKVQGEHYHWKVQGNHYQLTLWQGRAYYHILSHVISVCYFSLLFLYCTLEQPNDCTLK